MRKAWEPHKADTFAVIILNVEGQLTEEVEAGIQIVINNLCPSVEEVVFCELTVEELAGAAEIINETCAEKVDNDLKGVRVFCVDLVGSNFGFNYLTENHLGKVYEELVMNEKYENLYFEENPKQH